MAFWGHITEWGASTVAPAVIGLAMNAKEHAEQVGGQAAEWAANEVAPRAVGLAMEAHKHAEQVAPAVVGLAMNAKQHAKEISGHVAEWGAQEVAPRAVGLAMEAQKHAEQVSEIVTHWSTDHFLPAATGLAHNAAEFAKNAERHHEQASPAERWIIRGIVSVGLTAVAEGFGIPLPKLLIGPILGAAGVGTGKAANGRGAKSGAAQASQPRPVVASLGSGAGATRKETGNGAIGTLMTIAMYALALDNIVGLMAWL